MRRKGVLVVFQVAKNVKMQIAVPSVMTIMSIMKRRRNAYVVNLNVMERVIIIRLFKDGIEWGFSSFS